MAKKSTFRPAVTQRTEAPQVTRDKKGNLVLLCPHCKPTHPLNLQRPSPCGTIVEFKATQPIFQARFNNSMICAKCKKGGGQMVHYQNAYIHVHDCTPGVVTMTNPPETSLMAKLAFKNKLVRNLFKKIGEPMPIEEITPDGNRTGNIMGYFFYNKGA